MGRGAVAGRVIPCQALGQDSKAAKAMPGTWGRSFLPFSPSNLDSGSLPTPGLLPVLPLTKFPLGVTIMSPSLNVGPGT